MKHLRLAIESHSAFSRRELSECIAALEQITEGLPDLGGAYGRLGLESATMSKPSTSAIVASSKIALEAHSAGVWAMIAVAIGALIALVAKAVSFFTGGGSKGGGGGSSGGGSGAIGTAVATRVKAAESSETRTEAVKDLEALVEHVKPTVTVSGDASAKPVRIRSLLDLVNIASGGDDKLTELAKQNIEIYNNPLSHSVSGKLIIELFRATPEIIKALQKTEDDFATAAQVIESMEKTDDLTERLQRAQQLTELNLKGEFSKPVIGMANLPALSDLVAMTLHDSARANTHRSTKVYSYFENLATYVESNELTELLRHQVEIVQLHQSSTDKLEHVKELCQKLDSEDDGEGAGRKASTLVRQKVFKEYSATLHGVISLCNNIYKFVLDIEKARSGIYRILKQTVQYLEKNSSDFTEDELRRLKEIMDRYTTE